jgi:hypothetical protein
VSDQDDLILLRAEVLRRTGETDLAGVARTPAFARLEADLETVLRLRLGLDRHPIRARTRREVADTMGLAGPTIERAIAAIEEDAIAALGPPSAIGA